MSNDNFKLVQINMKHQLYFMSDQKQNTSGPSLVITIKKWFMVRPNENISVFWVTGLKTLGIVDMHIFFNYFFFLEKKMTLCILKGISPFKMHKIIFFLET